ncbi:MAG: ATP-grasp domain-containing protein [Planctomycetaceae bacterium]|nr:ATP-grasp domain-containing protein [Planctomycetaceae bacterium]
MTTLILSARHSEDNQALWRAAIQRQWKVVRLRGLTVPPLDDEDVVLYVEALLAPTIAANLRHQLLSPAEDWLPSLPDVFTRRSIRLTTLGALRYSTEPQFVKPPNDKLFTARVFASGDDLPADFEDDLPVLTADPVVWSVELRCFCLDQRVRAVSPYLRDGVHARRSDYAASEDELQQAIGLATQVLHHAEVATPRAIVIDVGRLSTGEWAVVEANSAWGSGIYGCDPNRVLDVVQRATVPMS